jgi:hypothetical protein
LRTPKAFPFRFCPLQPGLGPLNQKVALKLGNGGNDTHRHLPGSGGKVNATKGKAMNSYALNRQTLYGRSDIDCVSSKPIQLRDYQHVSCFHAFKQLSKALALRSSNGAGYRLGNNALRLNGEARTLNLTNLIFGGLIRRAYAAIRKGAGHHAFL